MVAAARPHIRPPFAHDDAMSRLALICVVCGCWSDPPPKVTKPPQPVGLRGSVQPPVVDVVQPIRLRPVAVELGGVMYAVSIDRTTRGAVDVSSAAPRADVRELGRGTSSTGVLVVLPATASFEQVRRIADALAASDRCMIPVVASRDGTLGTLGSDECPVPKTVAQTDDQNVDITLLITEEVYWVGLSRVNEFHEVRRSGREPSGPTALLRVMTQHKKSAFFVDREALEITAERKITWGEVAGATAMAAAAGWKTFRFLDKAQASAIPTL
jgi:hypothetical protein